MEIIIKKDDKKLSYKMNEPTFDVKALAFQAYMNGQKGLDHVGGGSIIFDSCFTGSAEELIKIKMDSDLYMSICFRCAEFIVIYEGEIKKN